MRTSKYSEEQIIGFFRQAEVDMPIKEIARKHRFSDTSFYKWLSKYGVMKASKAKRLQNWNWRTASSSDCWPSGTCGHPSMPLKASLAESASATHAPLWG